jgi:hypothetical protein
MTATNTRRRSRFSINEADTRAAPGHGYRHAANTSRNASERITSIEAILPTLATKADISEVRADIHKADASIRTWMIATVIGLFLGFAGLFLAVSSSFKTALPTTSPSAMAPLIIQVPAYASFEQAQKSPH